MQSRRPRFWANQIVQAGKRERDWRKDADDIQVRTDPATGAPLEPAYLLDGMPVEPDGETEDGLPYVEEVQNEGAETRFVYWADFRMGACPRDGR